MGAAIELMTLQAARMHEFAIQHVAEFDGLSGLGETEPAEQEKQGHEAGKAENHDGLQAISTNSSCAGVGVNMSW